MKTNIICLLAITFILSSVALNAEPANSKKQISNNTIESLLIGLESENYGLKTSSAFMLGELNVKRAVVPLMKMMRNGVSDESKIVAALALYKLGTPMSINALLQASRFESSERVRKMCMRFYLDFVSKQDIASM